MHFIRFSDSLNLPPSLPLRPGVAYLGTGYDPLHDRTAPPMIYPTELRAQRGGDTDVAILERFSLPMSMIGRSADMFVGADDQSAGSDAGGIQVFENIAQYRAHHKSLRGLEDADAGFMDSNSAEVEELFSRGYVVAEQKTNVDNYNIQLRPLSQYDAESTYNMADRLLFKGKAAASVDMHLRHLEEETSKDIREYSWHGMDFRERPMTFLTPAALFSWSALPYCCFSFEGILEDNAFPADDFESFFTQILEQDMMIHNEDITFAKKQKIAREGSRSGYDVGGSTHYTCNREPSSKGVGKDKLDIPRPCNYRDFPRFMVRNVGRHSWHAGRGIGQSCTTSLVVVWTRVRVCACARVRVCACVRVSF